MDLARTGQLLRQLDEPGSLNAESAALQLLATDVGCPLTESESFLTHSLRIKCYEVIDSTKKPVRPLLSADEAQQIALDDSWPSISLNEVLQLSPFQILSEVDLPAQRPETTAKSLPEPEFKPPMPPPSSNSWLKPFPHNPQQFPRTTARTSAPPNQHGRPSPWASAAPRPSLRDLEEERHPAEVHSLNNHVPSMPPPQRWTSRRQRERDDVPKPGFETALKKIKNVPGFSGLGGSQATQGEQDSTDHRKTRRGVRSSFVSPMRSAEPEQPRGGAMFQQKGGKDNGLDESTMRCLEELLDEDGMLPERLRNVDPKLIEQICNEILTKETKITWDDIAGLDHAKQCITETVIWPLTRPDIFCGTRAPAKGLLLFGPPGTGKTMIGRAIAGEINATFFSISASSLTSKWIGEGEKLVRALFGVASCKSPAVIFIDEIDSLLSMRKSEGEHESSRRMKTQFLIEMEGCSGSEEQLLVIGATNRPQELDEAARRRLAKRLYIPLPCLDARKQIVQHLLKKDNLLSLSASDLDMVAEKTGGYSGSDMAHLVREASMVPMRELLKKGALSSLRKEDVRPIAVQDFIISLKKVRPSVSPSEIVAYVDWNKEFGSADIEDDP